MGFLNTEMEKYFCTIIFFLDQFKQMPLYEVHLVVNACMVLNQVPTSPAKQSHFPFILDKALF